MPPDVDQGDSKKGFWAAGDTSISGQVTYVPTIHYQAALFASVTTGDWRGAASALLFKVHPELQRIKDPACKDAAHCVEISSATLLDDRWLIYDFNNSTFMATQQPDRDGNTLTVFNLVGPDFYPSMAYILRTSEDSFLNPGVLVRAGTEKWGGGYHWGDYTATAARPGFYSYDFTLWFAGEYSGKGGLISEWGTVIGYGSAK
jgi:hypothetical protein